MLNLIIIIGGIFLMLAVITKFLEGRAEPLTAEQQQRYSKIIMVLVGISLVLAMFKML